MVPSLVAIDGGDGRTNRATRDGRVRELFTAHFDGVWRTLRRLGLPEALADDVAQETFVTATRKLEAMEVGRERSFLIGTAIRLAANARRKRANRDAARAVDVDDVPMASGLPLPDEQVDARRTIVLLDRALDTLDEDLRVVLVLTELDALTQPEVAAMLGVPLGTVASRIRKARTDLAAAVTALRADELARRRLS